MNGYLQAPPFAAAHHAAHLFGPVGSQQMHFRGPERRQMFQPIFDQGLA
jgi:hypothetical protein